MNLFRLGNYRLHSGVSSNWKIDCDALTGADWETLAEMIVQIVGPFRAVQGVPSGGVALANYLQGYTSSKGPDLIVDDVLTTGGSMKLYRDAMLATSRSTRAIIGAVVFARGPCPDWVIPLFQMPSGLWVA